MKFWHIDYNVDPYGQSFNFHQELKLFSKKIYANNGGHFKIVSIIKKH